MGHEHCTLHHGSLIIKDPNPHHPLLDPQPEPIWVGFVGSWRILGSVDPDVCYCQATALGSAPHVDATVFFPLGFLLALWTF